MRAPRLLLDFIDAASGARHHADLMSSLEGVAAELGFEYVALLHSAALYRSTSRLIRYDNYPTDWDRRLVAHGPKVIDPILLAARSRISAFLWSDALATLTMSEAQRSIIDDAARAGLKQGVTVPANLAGEPEGSVSFGTARMRAIRHSQVFMADLIGRQAFEAARRIIGLPVQHAIQPPIGDRVRECIYWIARGKTDQDIADILGIGLETVRTYVKKAFLEVGVITRGQLVHEALRLGLIDFDPSIPPFG